MSDYQPAPTYAEVVLVDEKTQRPTFNPIWLAWFLGITQVLNQAGGTAVNHNSLAGLQGGTANQYYHLTQAEHAALGSFGALGNNRVLYSDGSGVLRTEAAFGYDETTNTLTVDKILVNGTTFGTLGVRGAATYGGAGPSTAADNLVVEAAAANVGISILSANTATGNIYFGDPDDNDIGRIIYEHSADRMSFYAGNTLAMAIASAVVSYSAAALYGSTAVPTTLGSINVNNGLYTASLGADNLGTGLTNATTKAARLGTPHFTNSEEPAAIFANASSAANNTLDIGGGTSLVNATTLLRFFTGATTTTVTGTEVFRLDNSQRIVIGGTASQTGPAGLEPRFQQHGIDTAGSAAGNFRWSADALGPFFSFAKSRGATIGTKTIVQSGDVCGVVSAYAANGSTFSPVGQIEFVVDGTPGAADMPGRIVFKTTPDGSVTLTEAMRIDNAQKVIFQVDRAVRFNNQTSSAAAAVGTLNNAPAAGNPAFWLRININGTDGAVPVWLG